MATCQVGMADSDPEISELAELSGKLYGALLKEQPDLTETNAQGIISKHVAGIARRKYCNYQFSFQLMDKDKRRVKGLNIRSMCGAARWLLQQDQLAPAIGRKPASQSRASADAGLRLPAVKTELGGKRKVLTPRTPQETIRAAVAAQQDDSATAPKASLKRARLEAPPAPAKAATSAVIPSHASQVVMQLEGYCPESFPLDVQHQILNVLCFRGLPGSQELNSQLANHFTEKGEELMARLPQDCKTLPSTPTRHLKGLAEGRSLDSAQVPEDLQGNLFTAAVAAGMRIVPHIKPESDRMAHRDVALMLQHNLPQWRRGLQGELAALYQGTTRAVQDKLSHNLALLPILCLPASSDKQQELDELWEREVQGIRALATHLLQLEAAQLDEERARLDHEKAQLDQLIALW